MAKLGLASVSIFLISLPVSAALNRSAVSVNGKDTFPCTVDKPCRTFTAAMAQTNPGGEVVALDSGDYDPFTITKSITVESAPGVYVGITSSAASAGKGINVTASPSDVIIIRGVTINGVLSAADTGIAVYSAVTALSIDHCLIQNFNNGGVTIGASGRYFVTDTTVRECGGGIEVGTKTFGTANGVAIATIDRCRVERTRVGGAIDATSNAVVTVRNTVVASNQIGLTAQADYPAEFAEMTVENCEVFDTAEIGVYAAGLFGGGSVTVRVSNTVVTRSGIAGFFSHFATFESWGNNKVRGNTLDSVGTITPVPTM